MPTNDPIKQRAYRKVRNALLRGDLMRPDKCENCGQTGRKATDGRTLIQAHHYDGYENPLIVKWLCVKCHSDETPRRCGYSNPNGRLSDKQVSEIRASTLSNKDIAAKYGIAPEYAWQIRKKVWRNTALIDKEPSNGS